MWRYHFKVISFVLLLELSNAKSVGQVEYCNITENGPHGVCLLIDDCPVPTVYSLTTTNACDNNNADLMVCCAGATIQAFKSESLLKCEEYSIVANCATGQLDEAELDENRFTSIKDFPHIGIILYRKPIDDGTRATAHHQGVLISSRYIVCAATAITDNDRIPVAVQLGKLDQVRGVRGETVQYSIEKGFVHPSYQPPSIYNDIALLKLAKQVKFSIYVRPICLPDTDLQTRTVYRSNYEKQGDAYPLVKYQRRVVPNAICNVTYHSYWIPTGINDDIICTTSTELGDSVYENRFDGAPITVDHPSIPCSRVLLGVSVETPSPRVADVAIKVYNYLEWIEGIIWADGEDA